MKIVQLTVDNREHFKDYTNPKPFFGTAPEALLEGFAQLPEAEVDVVCCVRQPLPSPQNLAPNIRYHSLVVPKAGWMSSGYLGCIAAVRKKLRTLSPNIVHGQGTERDCAITAVFSGFPSVLTVHGNMRLVAQVNQARPFSYGWLNAHLEGFTLPRADGVICITNYTREAVQSLARKTWLVPNAVDQCFFDIKVEPENPPTLLCVGLVCVRKNQNFLIRSLDRLAEQRRFRLLILGHVTQEDYGAEFRELLRTRPWCEHGGFADRESLRKLFATASGLVLPSLEDNCPMVVLEAMAAGVPVAAARVGGVPDLIAPDRTGLLFEPQDANGICDAAAHLLEDRQSAARLARTANLEARVRFHPKTIAARHLEIYREVLNKPV